MVLLLSEWLPFVVLLPLAGAMSCAATAPTFENTVQPFLAKHCYSCHNAKGNSGGLNLQDFTTARSITENRDEWEKVLGRISSGQMPPRQLPRPDVAELNQVVEWLRNELDGADKNAKPDPGDHALAIGESASALMLKSIPRISLFPRYFLPDRP